MPIDTATNAPSVPNLPKFAQNFFNVLATVVLRSPLYSIFSGVMLLFIYTGRKSGKSYTFPLGYARSC